MNQFTFEGKQKTFCLALIAVGLVCMGLSFFMDETPFHTRFWSNFLHNSVFFLGISLVAMFTLAVFLTAYTGWHIQFKRLWEAFAMFMGVGLILMMIVAAGIWMHWHHLYHWAADGIAEVGHANYDSIIAGKSGFLNKSWYTFGTLIFVGIWFFVFAIPFRRLSIAEDSEATSDNAHHSKMRIVAAGFVPIAAFTSCALIWQWIMSIDAHWYSTMFAWYTSASWFVSFMALSVILLIYLKSKGYYEQVTAEHLHDMGKYVFGFSIFWTYLWFSQFMLIWYANIGEETVYFHTRMNEYPVLFFGNLIMNFALPFLILMRNSTKRKYGTLLFTCGLVIFGHWWDFFQMIKPGALHTAMEAAGHGHGAGHAVEAAGHGLEHAVEHAEHATGFVTGFTLPGILELGTFAGFLGLFLFVVFTALGKAALSPKNDPYLAESLHHHT